MEYFSLSFLALALVYFAVIGVVNAEQSKTAVARSFLALLAVLMAWPLCVFLLHVPSLGLAHFYILRIEGLFYIPSTTFFLMYVYFLIHKRLDLPFFVIAGITIICVLLYPLTDLAVRGIGHLSWGRPVEIRGPLFIPITLVPLVVGLYSLGLLIIHAAQVEDKSLKVSIKLVIVGGAIAMGGAWSSNVLVTSLIDYNAPRLGALIPILFIPFVYMAMTRERYLTRTVAHIADDLFQELHDGVLLLDRRNNVRRANPAAKLMLGRRHNLIGKNFTSDILGREKNSIHTQSQVSINDRMLLVSPSAQVSRWADLGKVVLIHDITEQTLAQEVLRRSRVELEAEIDNRTKKLRQAQKLESVGALAGGIAHHFNNLLTVIMGFGTAARDDMERGTPARNDLEEVLMASKRAKDIIQQLRSFSGHDDPTPRVLDARRLVKDVMKLAESSVPPEVKVSLNLTSSEALILGDQTQLHQVMMNLVTNAVHSMKGAGGELKIVVDVIETSQANFKTAMGKIVVLRVEDEGTGIAPRALEHIFEPFFTTKPSGEGTGLGLPTAKRIIEKIGGEIEVDSTPGQGSSFTAHLPLAERKYDSVNPPAEQDITGNERVLVIDDQAQILRAAKRILEPLGYHVTTLSDPIVAVETFQNDNSLFDIIVVDYTMPQMNGAQFASQIRLLHPVIPIIVASGNTGGDIRSACLGAGVNLLVDKPLTKATIGGAIRRLLDE